MAHPEIDPPLWAGLRGVALFNGLPDSVLSEVTQACRFKRCRPRQAVMSRADLDRDCYFVLSGRLRVVALSPGGREVSFRDVTAGAMVGEIAALDGGPRSATVLALEETLLARLDPDDFAALLQRHWAINQRLLQHLADMARQLTERVYQLSTLSVQQRLCAELLRICLAGEGAHGDRVVLQPAPRHSELAARIGSYREQVTRELAELARQGVVVRDEGALVIDDVRRLAERIEAGRPAA